MFASLLVVALIGAIAWAGSAVGLSYLFGVVLPYVAVVTFFLGVIWRMVYWAKSPVPFSIPTTGGQEKSLDFIKQVFENTRKSQFQNGTRQIVLKVG